MEFGATQTGEARVRISIRTTPARIDVNNARTKLEIDSAKPREELGYRGWHSKIADLQRFSYSRASKGIERRVRGGMELARIENGGNPIAEQARRRLDEYWSDHSVEMAFLPKSPPQVRVEFTPAEISIEPARLDIEFVPVTGLNIIV